VERSLIEELQPGCKGFLQGTAGYHPPPPPPPPPPPEEPPPPLPELDPGAVDDEEMAELNALAKDVAKPAPKLELWKRVPLYQTG